jgi:pimeloyl-ACP methyl ester carboxylesterase
MNHLPEEIEIYRDRKWRREETLKIETAAEVEQMIEDLGFCLTLTDSRTNLPSVYIAVCGRRDAHLPAIRVPVLCINGTRDTLCTPDLMNRALDPVTAPWQMHWIEGADHSFHVLKSTGRTDAQVLTEIADVAAQWIATLPGRRV